MKSVTTILVLVLALTAISVTSGDAGADAARKLPSFEMKDLQEVEYRLTDERFKGKKLLIAAFGTWQQPSIAQARELQKFHKANPDVEIIAFVVDSLAEARDFVAREQLTYPCYKSDPATRIGPGFNRLFKTRKGKVLTLNKAPFVMLADADRNVYYAELGLVSAETLGKELK